MGLGYELRPFHLGARFHEFLAAKERTSALDLVLVRLSTCRTSSMFRGTGCGRLPGCRRTCNSGVMPRSRFNMRPLVLGQTKLNMFDALEEPNLMVINI